MGEVRGLPGLKAPDRHARREMVRQKRLPTPFLLFCI